MTATPFDSAYLHKLFATGEAAKLFTDSAEVRAMMIVLGALAKVQGASGLIPETAGKAIHRASLELQIDPGGLADDTARDGTPVPSVVASFGALMQAPEYVPYLCHETAPEDIEDSALMLRMRQVLAQADAGLTTLLDDLGAVAGGGHAPDSATRAARAGWPLLALCDELALLRQRALPVALSDADESLRAALAEALNLTDPGRGWRDDRAPLRDIAGWSARLVTALAALARPDATATPQAAALEALRPQAAALLTVVNASPEPQVARLAERLALPQLLLCANAALSRAQALAKGLRSTPGGTGDAPDEARRFAKAVRSERN